MLVWSQTDSLVSFQTRFCTSSSSFGSWAPWRWRPQRAQTSSTRPWDRSWQPEPFTTSSGWPSLICSSRVNASSELHHWFKPAVLNSSPRAPPLCICRMLLLSLQMFVLFERKCPAKWTSQDIPPWFQFEANVYIPFKVHWSVRDVN